jgi:hypothetical protein
MRIKIVSDGRTTRAIDLDTDKEIGPLRSVRFEHDGPNCQPRLLIEVLCPDIEIDTDRIEPTAISIPAVQPRPFL